MIKIVTDSVSSIKSELAQARDIEILSLFVNYDGVEYDDAVMDIDAFYEDIYDMADNPPLSSQPSQAATEELFTRIAQQGDQLLGVFIGSTMSGTYESAVRVAREVKEKFPDFEYSIVDSTTNSFDEGWAVMSAVEKRDEGGTLQECEQAALNTIPCSRIVFSPESLNFLKKGGRIGKAAALVGSVVRICPIITVNNTHVCAPDKVRTHKKALASMFKTFKTDVENCGLKNIVVQYVGNNEEAKKWAREVIEPFCQRDVKIIPVSPVIGAHVGPAIGLAYECERPIPNKFTGPVSTLAVSSYKSC